MFNEILELIQKHLNLLELALNSSNKICFYANLGDIDQVNNETENRERLVNIIEKLQFDIEKKISALGPQDLLGDSILILKTWFADLALWSDKMIELDQKTVDILTQQKEDATKEIATIFKNKEMHKGYNNTIKK